MKYLLHYANALYGMSSLWNLHKVMPGGEWEMTPWSASERIPTWS
jgi:hypothetical protein